jgi:hypothetical protein
MGLAGPVWNQRRSRSNKKTLVSAQNIENKRSGKILPPRSMVIKVVRGKILGTLELSLFLSICDVLSILRLELGRSRGPFIFSVLPG